MNDQQVFETAERLYQQGLNKPSLEQYEKILEHPGYGGIAHFRMGEVYNRMRDCDQSRYHHYEAFRVDPALFSKILPKELPHRTYQHKSLNLISQEVCTLCGLEARALRCYNTGVSYDFTPGFDPVRIWMYCEPCSHYFAHNRPSSLEDVLKDTKMTSTITPDPKAFAEECKILKKIMSFTSGTKILEVGSGVGEFAGVALELLYDIECIEIRSYYAQLLEQKLQIKVHRSDFFDFDTDHQYDAVVMGDVLEHFVDPILALKKVYKLLNKHGVFWLSTPNFQSAHTRLLDDSDPMWRVCEHLQFFSYVGLRKILIEAGFEVLDYQVSTRYNGSMEICARKV